MPSALADPRLTAAARTVNEELMHQAIRHSIALERYKAGEVRKITRFLDTEVLPDAANQLEARLKRLGVGRFDARINPDGVKRYRDMVSATREQLRTGLNVMGDKVARDMRKLAVTEAEIAVAHMHKALPVQIDLTTPSPRLLKSIIDTRPMQGRLLKDWSSKLGERVSDEVERQVKIGLAQGESVPQLARRVQAPMEATRKQAEALVRTSVNHTSAHAREDTYVENEETIEWVRYVATLDARTSLICASLDGNEYKVGQGPRPPQHINCRSTVVPVMKGWEDLGLDPSKLPPSTREAVLNGMKGEVPDTMTYGQWLKSQPRSVQEEALGKGRAKLFADGKVQIDKFTGPAGKPLTLKELRGLEGLKD